MPGHFVNGDSTDIHATFSSRHRRESFVKVVATFFIAEVEGHPRVLTTVIAVGSVSSNASSRRSVARPVNTVAAGHDARAADNRVKALVASTLFGPQTGLQPQSIVDAFKVQGIRIDPHASEYSRQGFRSIDRREVLTDQRQGLPSSRS